MKKEHKYFFIDSIFMDISRKGDRVETAYTRIKNGTCILNFIVRGYSTSIVLVKKMEHAF